MVKNQGQKSSSFLRKQESRFLFSVLDSGFHRNDGYRLNLFQKAKVLPFFDSLILLISAFLFFGAVSVYLGQDANWDLRNYHFYNAYAFLTGRLDFDYGPAQVQTYLNPVLDLPFYFLVKFLPPVWVGFILGGIHGINFWLLYEIAYQVFLPVKPAIRRGLSFACAAVGMYGPANIALLGTTFNDNIVSIFVLGSVLIMIRVLASSPNLNRDVPGKSLIYAGVLLGMGIGLKLAFMIYGIGLAIGLLAIKTNLRSRLEWLVVWSISLFGGIVASSGYWMLKLWEKFESPLFPFYNRILQSPYFECIDFFDRAYLPKSMPEKLFYPFYFIKDQGRVMGLESGDIRFAIIYALLIGAVSLIVYSKFIMWSHKKANDPILRTGINQNISRFLVTVFVASYIVWQIVFSYYRYLVPLELLSPVLAGVLLSFIILSERKRLVILLILFMAIVFAVRSPDWGRLPWSDSFFDVKVPAIENAENSIVVMAGGAPTAFVIPFFPREVRFVRVFSNFTNPACNNKMQSEMEELIRTHTGPLYLLSRRPELENDKRTLASYELHANGRGCKAVPSRLDSELLLCRLEWGR